MKYGGIKTPLIATSLRPTVIDTDGGTARVDTLPTPTESSVSPLVQRYYIHGGYL
jgi:hypothetical protein